MCLVPSAQSGYAEARHWCEHVASNVEPIDLAGPAGSLDPNRSICARCPHAEENWLCLACQQVFCGRFAQGHMLQHFQDTGHCVAAGLADISFWSGKRSSASSFHSAAVAVTEVPSGADALCHFLTLLWF